jgi:hypothetical protein
MTERGTRPEGIFGMSDSHNPSAVVEASNQAVAERRTPGSIASVSPALTALLRRSNVLAPDSEESQEKGVLPTRGILFGVAISGLFWAVLIWII